MLMKLITNGDTPCTTCSNNGRNKVTEVCVIPCRARIHSASPIGALIDEAPRGRECRRPSVDQKVRPTSATATAIKRTPRSNPGTDPLAATHSTTGSQRSEADKRYAGEAAAFGLRR